MSLSAHYEYHPCDICGGFIVTADANGPCKPYHYALQPEQVLSHVEFIDERIEKLKEQNGLVEL